MGHVSGREAENNSGRLVAAARRQDSPGRRRRGDVCRRYRPPCSASQACLSAAMLWKAASLLLLALLLLLLPLHDCVQQELFSNAVWNEATIYDFIEDDIFFEVLYPKELGYTYRLRQAKNFGTPFERIFKGVRLVLADPLECCSLPYNALELQGAVALVSRGGCSFVSKAVKAEEAGAFAVIVMDNDKDNDELYVEMVEDNTNRNPNIPAAFLLGRSGYMIAKTLLDAHEEAAIINIPINMTSVPFHKLNQPPWILW